MSTLAITDKVTINGEEITYNIISGDKLADYKGLRDMYYSINGFKNGSYLIQHPREEDDFFIARKQLSNYENVFQPELDAQVTPIFNKAVNREASGSKVADEFILDPSQKGLTMNEYMGENQLHSELYGCTFLVADAPKDMPKTGLSDGSPQFMPYSYYLTPLQITGYKYDSKGALDLLIFPKSIDTQNNIGGGTEVDGDPTLIAFVRNADGSGYQIEIEDGVGVAETEVKFAVWPVKMRETNTREQNNILPTSRYIGMFRDSLKMFNLQSQFDDVLFKCGFTLLTYHGTLPDNLKLDNGNILEYEGDGANAPEFLVTPTNHIDAMSKKIEQMRTNMKENMNSTVVISANASGEARIATEQRRFEKLGVDSQDLRDCEYWLVTEALSNFTKKNINYELSYDTDFESLTKVDQLASKQVLIDTGLLSAKAQNEVVQDMVAIEYSGDPKRRDEINTIVKANVVDDTDQENNGFNINDNA